MSQPPEWIKLPLSDLAATSSGGTPSRNNPRYFTGDIPWVKSGELGDSTVHLVDEHISQEAVADSSAKVFPKGTLCVALYGATVGKLGILGMDAATNQAVCGIFLPPEIETRFAFWYLRSIRRALVAQGKGGAQPNISQGVIKATDFPLAPLPEQRRIVAKIEELFSELDAGNQALDRAQAKMERYRASVLKAAVEGKLTEQWRKENPAQETGQELLDRILVERRARWEEEQLAKYEVKGKKSPKNWQAKYKQPVGPTTTEVPELPDGWCWASVDTFALVTKLAGFEYTKYVEYSPEGDLPVIKAENAGPTGFKRTQFSLVDSKTVSHLTRSKLVGGEVLVVFVGSIGRVARVPEDRQYFLGPNIALVRPSTSLVRPAYLECFLRSPVGQRILLGYAKAVSQPSLSMGSIRKVSVAVPPIGEQDRIVQTLEESLYEIEIAVESVQGLARRSTVLRQSILKRAFGGRLVPQDPTDEPASELLERIRAQREAEGRKKTARKKKNPQPELDL